MLNEKENAIHLLKKKLKIPSTQLIQTSKLTEFEKLNEDLNAELIDCKARLLKFGGHWVKKEKTFETKQAELENKLKEKNMEQQVQVISSSVQFGTDSLSQAMS